MEQEREKLQDEVKQLQKGDADRHLVNAKLEAEQTSRFAAENEVNRLRALLEAPQAADSGSEDGRSSRAARSAQRFSAPELRSRSADPDRKVYETRRRTELENALAEAVTSKRHTWRYLTPASDPGSEHAHSPGGNTDGTNSAATMTFRLTTRTNLRSPRSERTATASTLHPVMTNRRTERTETIGTMQPVTTTRTMTAGDFEGSAEIVRD